MSIEELYEQHIRPLSPEQRLQLLTMIARDLAQNISVPKEHPAHSLLELEGLGAEIWQGKDAQEYVNELRNEWSNRL